MKKLIIVTLITTCAALWPHNNATEQTHPSQPRKPL